MNPVPEVAVIGLGYIGLPTAVVLAQSGATVCGVDLKPDLIACVNEGTAPFAEPGLAEALADARASGRLWACHDVPVADSYVIAVPTPVHADKSPDLSLVRAAAEQLAEVLNPGALVILESTSPPGTTARLADWLTAGRSDLDPLDVDVAYCPERVLPGQIMREVVHNDRVVGGLTARAAQRAAALYGRFCRGAVVQTEALTAEMTKLVENSYRDVNIAFANELSLICDTVGVDVWKLIELANRHPRVNVLHPGPGVGGHCIAVDPWFLVAADPPSARLIATARAVNDSKPQYVVDRIIRAVADTDRPRITLLGLSFKANVDDLRQSPALEIATRVATELPGADVVIVEPHVDTLPAALAALPNARLSSLTDALKGSRCVALLVDHDEFAVPPQLSHDTVAIDTRGAWSPPRQPA